jgi:hypothetical protein
MIARDPERLACTSWQGLSSPDGCARANHRGSRSRARGGRAPSSRVHSWTSARGGALQCACSGPPGDASGPARARRRLRGRRAGPLYA